MKRGFIILLFAFILLTNASAYDIYYYHSDNLGSPIAITDENASVVWSADYKPFGQTMNEQGENNYQYNSKEKDDSGLLYYGARYYDAEIGRFTSADTIKGSIANPQSLNRYVYTLNNPLKYIDPSGNVELQANEYIVPSKALKAMYVITMDNAEWEDITSNPGAVYVSRNFLPGNFFEFLPFISSPKERFFDLLKQRTSFSNDEANSFYNMLTTPGNIVLAEGFSDDKLVHERIHSKISQLSENEKEILYNSKEEFVTYMLNDEFEIEFLGTKHETSFASQELGYCVMPICMGSWSELYAYMGQYELFPEKNDWQGKPEISPEVYEEFKKQHPEAYEIYQKIIEETMK